MQPELESAGNGGGIGAGGCPDLQEKVCTGGAELVTDGHVQGSVFFFLIQ